MPPFPAFYEAINGRPPFPWQVRLARHVADVGAWPREIGVPTGLGKTACLDIAIWWLASQADQAPAERTAPTRIWWLVNRRLLVDSTFEHAQSISDALRDPERVSGRRESLLVGQVAERLRSLGAGPDGDPIEVIRLRGGVRSRRPIDPSQPAVVLSTIPMYGSRLLFRGYGSSRTMRPIDAALAGVDSLVLVDEAHLAKHLIKLVSDLADCTPHARGLLGEMRSRPQVVSLTATGDVSEEGRFDLDGDDEAHPIVRQRLDASKRIAVRTVPRNPDKAIAQAVISVLAESERTTSCLAFANTPTTARSVFDRLRKSRALDDADVLLLTGRTREREAEKTRARVLDRERGMAASRDPGIDRLRHLVVVATQTLEVGADVDAEFLVTETCGVRALIQRLGRLNRLGRFPDARAEYVHAPPRKGGGGRSEEVWPVYGTEPGTVHRRLQAAIAESGDNVSLSPRNVSRVLETPSDDPGRAPEVLNGLLWEWVKTTTPPEGEAPVEPYFSGISGAAYSVSVIWRAHVPEAGQRLWPRPSDREAVAVPIGEIRETLGDDGDVTRLATDGITVEAAAAEDLRPGNVVILPVDRGLLDEFGWNPDCATPVVDMSIETHGLPLRASAIKRLRDIPMITRIVNTILGISDDEEELDDTERRDAIKELLRALADETARGWDSTEWLAVVGGLRPDVVGAYREVSRLRSARTAKPDRQSDEIDERSMADAAVQLALHGRAVAAKSRLIAERLGLPQAMIDVLHKAGRLHDLGKADRRFQRWLDPMGTSTTLIAKSPTPNNQWEATRIAAGWPKGGRHESLSARLVEAWLAAVRGDDGDHGMDDLLIHLVITHHGRGRPLIPPVDDATSDIVSGTVQGHSVHAPASLATVDWEQPTRFRRLHERWGPWGLALLEAIIRQADHAVSSSKTTNEMDGP